MDAILSLHDSRMADDDMAELCFAMRQDIARETGRPHGGLGRKGDAVIIGAIGLAALKSYVERKPTLRFEIEAADGRKLKLEAEHFSYTQIEQTLQAVKQLCAD